MTAAPSRVPGCHRHAIAGSKRLAGPAICGMGIDGIGACAFASLGLPLRLSACACAWGLEVRLLFGAGGGHRQCMGAEGRDGAEPKDLEEEHLF